MRDALCDELGLDVIEVAKLVKKQVDAAMANGIATELRTRGYEGLHRAGLRRRRSVACLRHRFRAGRQQGAGTAVLVDLLGLRRRHREPDAHPRDEHGPCCSIRIRAASSATSTPSTAASRNWSGAGARTGAPGLDPALIRYRLELDMRYGNQRVQTAVVTPLARLRSQRDVLQLMELFHARYGERFGEGSQSPETGVRINTLRVCAYVEQPSVRFASRPSAASRWPRRSRWPGASATSSATTHRCRPRCTTTARAPKARRSMAPP